VSTDAIALLIGAALGLVVVGVVVWEHRREVIEGYRNLLGLPQTVQTGSIARSSPSGARRPRSDRLLALSVCAAVIGSVVVAAVTDSSTTRTVSIVAAAVGLLILLALTLAPGARR